MAKNKTTKAATTAAKEVTLTDLRTTRKALLAKGDLTAAETVFQQMKKHAKSGKK